MFTVILVLVLFWFDNILLEGYVLTKKDDNGLQVLISENSPTKLENLDSDTINEMATKNRTMMWVPVDKSMYIQIQLGHKLNVEYDGILLESLPPIIANVESVKIASKHK
ncbi:DUF3221 domain-containing protein [Lysinibacillus agricola]|uniref:DUF3221 domain-containing protein n=1 Tax=Lysinibacillus agricola TaxID=2590012 RepID=A0ABX7AMS7_9BACI|nr:MULTISPECIES: DUF3221 domain-containing protein [Lysinibacillus]KOS60081.1 hypothetical protein AN161_25090 [Lysinibacillus sp. FJAT-14222]QQP11154.1 DUF3221 domain-containing protein [Lysinibacillus agricola]